MPNNSLISKITDEAARKVIYHLSLQIEALTYRLDKLEQQNRQTQAIGFNVKEGEKHLGIVFKNVKYNLYD